MKKYMKAMMNRLYEEMHGVIILFLFHSHLAIIANWIIQNIMVFSLFLVIIIIIIFYLL